MTRIPNNGPNGTAAVSLLSAVLALVLVVFAVSPAPAADLRGVALIVGNGAYEALPELANPENDADAIEELLSDLGFDSVSRTDRDAGQLKRDLERFVEDAADADVAVLYYAGHGIEAGGENWLVPTDADLSALDDAAGRLVPLSDVLRRLREVVPVTILLLDACRDNPFPPGVSLKKTPDAEPVPVAAGGLAETRGAARVTVEAAPEDNLGMVIGFAAEPGRPALDGDGGHSPYAAALLRHLAAMAGEEFGTVMRMVAEEVYLKTGGRQRPWVNESLRRLLYFGEAPAPVSGPEGDILAERRGLLLTIADLPLGERRTVERVAANGGVPMDALFGMLNALGQDIPADPDELEKLLTEQAARLRQIMSERITLKTTDADLARLSALADRAVEEGAYETAVKLRNAAKDRIATLSVAVDQAETDLLARRREFATIYAKAASDNILAYDLPTAAENYGLAFAQLKKVDPQLAASYRIRQAEVLTEYGELSGNVSALKEAVGIADNAVLLARAHGDEMLAARASIRLGLALRVLGIGEGETASLRRSAAILGEALDYFEVHGPQHRTAIALAALGTTLHRLGQRETGTETLEKALAVFDRALALTDKTAQPGLWAGRMNDRGLVLYALGLRQPGVAQLQEALDSYRATLAMRNRDTDPGGWATTLLNMANASSMIAIRGSDAESFVQAADAYRRAMEVFDKGRAPRKWGVAQNNLGIVLKHIGILNRDATAFEASLEAFDAALGVLDSHAQTRNWARTVTNRSSALYEYALLTGRSEPVDEAIGDLEAVLSVLTPGQSPREWAIMRSSLGRALLLKGKRDADMSVVEAAHDVLVEALRMQSDGPMTDDRAATLGRLGEALVELGRLQSEHALIRQGRAALLDAGRFFEEAGVAADAARMAGLVAAADRLLGLTGGPRPDMAEFDGKNAEPEDAGR